MVKEKSSNTIINDKKFTNFKSDIRNSSPIYDYYAIVDFLEDDGSYEIGISAYGRSDDLETCYYYKSDTLNYIGSLYNAKRSYNKRRTTII